MKKILFSLLLILFLVTGCGKKLDDNKNSGDTGKKTLGEIKDISIGYDNIVALSENDELYVIGKEGLTSMGLGEDVDYASKPTRVAEDVKRFIDGGAIYYINSKNDLYYTGLKLQGGVEQKFSLLKSNVKQVVSNNGLCVFIVDLDNNLYGVVNKFGDGSCALPYNKYSEFTQIASDVKQTFTLLYSHGYVNNNKELYFINNGEEEYRKIMDNVKEVFDVVYTLYIWTEDNILYKFNETGETIEKISENVVSVSYNDWVYYETSDGNLYYDSKLITFDNVEKMLYSNNDKYIYINKDNKIEMKTEYDNYVLDNDISSLEEMLKFVGN